MLALLRRLCGGLHDAEDLFQETAIRVWKQIDRQPTLSNPRAWLMTIAYRVFLDFRNRNPATDEFTDKADDRDPQPGLRAELNEDADRVNRAIAELSAGVREVVLLHYTGGLSLRETAAAMGIHDGTVKSRLNTGLQQLRRRLK